jgi:Amt family ammonium transporter
LTNSLPCAPAPEFSLAQIGVQGIGIAAAFLWTFPVSYAAFKLADVIVGIRLDDDVERLGLDRHEHDAEAYPEFATHGDTAQHTPVATGPWLNAAF